MSQGCIERYKEKGFHISFTIVIIILLMVLTSGTVSANPVSYDHLGDTFFDNIILIFLLNLPLDALVLAYVLDKHYYSRCLFNSHRLHRYLDLVSSPFKSQINSGTSIESHPHPPPRLMQRFSILTIGITLVGTFVDYTFREYITPFEFIHVFEDMLTGSSITVKYVLVILLVLALISLSVFLSYLFGIRFDPKKALNASYHFFLLNVISWTILSIYTIQLGDNIGWPIPNGWIILPVLFTNIVVIIFLLQAYQHYLMITSDHLEHTQQTIPPPSDRTIPTPTMRKSTAVCVVWIFLTAYALVAIADDNWWEVPEEERRYELFNIAADIYGDDEGNYVVEIVKVDPDAIIHKDITYEILDGNGTVVDDLHGSLESIYNTTNGSDLIYFEEYDGNVKLSAGDSFHIRSEANAGMVKPGYALILRERYDNDVLNAFEEPFILP